MLAAVLDLAAQPAEKVRVIRGCGRVRWDVKTLTDDDTLLIDFAHPRTASIAELAALPALGPDEYTPRQFSERSVYLIEAQLHGWRIEADRTLLLSLRDAHGGASLVASIPDPDCPEVAATSRAADYRRLREWVRASFPTTADTLARPARLRLAGVGMYDRLRDQPGMAENGFVIMPVTTITHIVPLEPVATIPHDRLPPAGTLPPSTAPASSTSTSTTAGRTASLERRARRTRPRYRRTRRVRRSTKSRRRRYRGSRRPRRTTRTRPAATGGR